MTCKLEAVFQSTAYASEFSKRLNEQRLSCLFCDVILIAEDVKFPAHCNVLAASSDYFKVMFNINMLETKHSEVFMVGITAEALGRILNYVYTGTLHVTKYTVVDVIFLSSLLMMFDVAEFCWNYLVGTLDTHNCIERKLIADNVSSEDIASQVSAFVLQHFTKLNAETLLNCPVVVLKELFLNNNLFVDEEIDVLHIFLKLCSCNMTEMKNLEILLDSIRFGFLNVTAEQLCDVLMSYGIVEKSKLYQLVLESSVMNTGAHEARFSYKQEEVLLCVGGHSECSVLSDVCAYLPLQDQWYKLTPMNHPRRGFGLVVINNNLFAVGGTMEVARDRPVPFIERHHARNDTWEEIYSTSASHLHQDNATIGCFRGCVILAGGYHNETLSTVVELNPENGEWSNLPCMNVPREEHVIVTNETSIYVIGGKNQSGALDSVEKYDAETGTWCNVQPMNTRRYHACAVWFNQKLWIFGGYDGEDVLTSAEVYDPCEDRWRMLPDMTTPRMKFAVTVFNNHAYVIGGMTGPRGPMIPDVQKFNFSDSTWSGVNSMSEAKMEMNCATMKVFSKFLK